MNGNFACYDDDDDDDDDDVVDEDYTHVHYFVGCNTVFWSLTAGLLSACILVWLPCLLRQCKDHQHMCRHCGMAIAYTRKC